MMNTTNDPVFGSMEFDYGWCKEDTISLFGKPVAVEILVEAEIGQPISDIQQNLYRRFCSEIDTLSSTALEHLKNYYIENLPAIGLQVDDPTQIPEEEELADADLINMIEPKTLFFPQDDFYAILCNCIWEPINGLAIIISPDGISIDTQDAVL
jgi:hypothetical protein